jgi:hypothetical protein
MAANPTEYIGVGRFNSGRQSLRTNRSRHARFADHNLPVRTDADVFPVASDWPLRSRNIWFSGRWCAHRADRDVNRNGLVTAAIH